MHPNAERVRTELRARGAGGEVVELAASTRTTPEELARVTGGVVVDVRENG